MFVYLSDIHKTGVMMLTKVFVLLEVRRFKIMVIKLIIIYFYLAYTAVITWHLLLCGVFFL
jgi:hypothetical protein